MSEKTVEEQVKELQRDYLRQWRLKNPHKVQEYNKRYWEKKTRAKNDNSKGEGTV